MPDRYKPLRVYVISPCRATTCTTHEENMNMVHTVLHTLSQILDVIGKNLIETTGDVPIVIMTGSHILFEGLFYDEDQKDRDTAMQISRAMTSVFDVGLAIKHPYTTVGMQHEINDMLQLGKPVYAVDAWKDEDDFLKQMVKVAQIILKIVEERVQEYLNEKS